MLTLLLDLDGTLTDPREGIVGSLRYALERLDVAPPSDVSLTRCIGPPLAHTFAQLLGDDAPRTRIDAAIGHYRERFAERGWRENRVYSGIPELLAQAGERDWHCLLATSKPTVFAERIAEHFDLRAGLAGVYGSELDERRSDKAELIAYIAAREGLDPERTVMVGDRRHDVEGARANGIDTLGVTWGFGGRDELRSAGARWLCDEPATVLHTLDAAFAARA